jgi:hypothetical protein
MLMEAEDGGGVLMLTIVSGMAVHCRKHVLFKSQSQTCNDTC